MIRGVSVKLKNSNKKINLNEPARHCDCFRVAKQEGIELSQKADDQGFFTDDVEFMNRKDAMKYVKKVGQKIISDNKSDILFSEDLW